MSLKVWQQNVVFWLSFFAYFASVFLLKKYLFSELASYFIYPAVPAFLLFLYDRYFPDRKFIKLTAIATFVLVFIPSVVIAIAATNQPICDAKYGQDYNCYASGHDAALSVALAFMGVSIAIFFEITPLVYLFFLKRKAQWSPVKRAFVTFCVSELLIIAIPLAVFGTVRNLF